jgi:pyridinium-3,5-biscarboxylic acid mononucleotide sulfurtransferase
MDLGQKHALLLTTLEDLGSLLVAYSGGTDSAYLAYAAHQVLGEKMLAVIADSPSLPRAELTAALAFAVEHNIPIHILPTEELENPDYQRNDAQRCFHCKDELFTQMEQARMARGFEHIAYGMNLDDRGEFRPGQQAAAQHHAVAPLVTAKLTKPEIRALAQQAGLSLWDKPASACLSSRIEYGRAVTREIFRRLNRQKRHSTHLASRKSGSAIMGNWRASRSHALNFLAPLLLRLWTALPLPCARSVFCTSRSTPKAIAPAP